MTQKKRASRFFANFGEVNRDVSRNVNRNVRKVGLLKSVNNGRVSEILLKKRVVWTLEASDSTVGGKQVFFPESNRGFAVSGAENGQRNRLFFWKTATPELNFARENLHFVHEMWPNETARKSRKNPFMSPSGRNLCVKNPEELKKNVAFQPTFECNSPVKHGWIYPTSPEGGIALQSPKISHFLTSTWTLTWTLAETSKNRLARLFDSLKRKREFFRSHDVSFQLKIIMSYLRESNNRASRFLDVSANVQVNVQVNVKKWLILGVWRAILPLGEAG